MPTVTRFAPSPTNNQYGPNGEKDNLGLHIGGCRTALLNYIVATQHNGKFIMRLEDTDEERSNEDCLRCMLRDFKWLGIEFTKGFIETKKGIEQYHKDIPSEKYFDLRQSKRKEIYNKHAAVLKERKYAYEKDGAIWFSMPKKKISFYDGINQVVSMPKESAEDFVIIKNTGMPTFYFAMTVDDIMMGITDIIRGTEHINTAFRQISLIQALLNDDAIPNFYHVPIVLNPDGSKMSKRQTSGQVNLWEFVREGYLKDAIINYLLLLGWNRSKEIGNIFKLQDIMKQFRIDKIGKNMPKFDYQMLNWVNLQHIHKLTFEQFTNEMNWYGTQFYPNKLENLKKNNLINKLYKCYYENIRKYKNIRKMKDIWESAEWMTDDEIHSKDISKDYCQKFDNVGLVLKSYINKIKDRDNKLEDLTQNINNDLVAISQDCGIHKNNIAQILRFALTGSYHSLARSEDIIKEIGATKTVDRIQKLYEVNLKIGSKQTVI